MNPEIWESIKHYKGWCSHEKAVAMYELTRTQQPKVCVEIGVFGARSLAVVAMALRDAQTDGGLPGQVWGIDPWTNDAAIDHEENPANRDWWTKVDLDAVRDEAIRRLNASKLLEWARIIVSKSNDAAPLFHSIDWLHIDGNHNEECSTNDVLLWVPKVRKGGYIWFDDADWPQTRKAISILDGGMAERVRDIHSSDGGMARLYVKQ